MTLPPRPRLGPAPCSPPGQSASAMGPPTSTVAMSLLVALMCCAVIPQATADSAGDYDLPGPGLAYGGIPYGSQTGNVAAYFNRGGARYNYKPGVSSGRFSNNYYDFYSKDFD